MTIIGEAFVRVSPDTKNFGAETEKGVLGPSGIGSVVKKVGLALGGAFAFTEGIGAIKDVVAAGRESNKIAAQTQAVIKSTGGAANVTEKQISSLAESIANKTGVDDEAIQKAQNLLLTFTKVRNETGKGNDIFNQATQTLVDMGAALGTDAASSAIQLGKALNDPVKGVVALSRVGVTFTKEQKDQIKTLAESGKVAEAQKIILRELATEFGGSAAAQATASDRLKVTLGNLQEDLGNALIPIIDRVATAFANHLPRALEIAGAAFGAVKRFVQPAITAVQTFINAFTQNDNFGLKSDQGVLGFIANIGETIADVKDTLTRGVGDIGKGLVIDIAGFFGIQEDDPRLEGFFKAVEKVEDVIGSVVNFVKTKAIPAFQRLVEFIGDNLKPILIGVALVLGGVLVVAIASAVASVVGFIATIGPTVAVVAAVAAAVFAAVKAFERFPIVREVIADVVAFVTTTFQKFRAFVEDVWPDIQEAIGHVLVVIGALIDDFVKNAQLAWELFGDDILKILGAAWDQIRLIIETAIGLISGIIRFALAVINGDWSKAWDALKGIVETVFNALKGTVENITTAITGAIGAIFEVVRGLAKEAFDVGALIMGKIVEGIKSLTLDAIRAIVDFILKGIPDFIEERIPGLEAFKKSIGALKEPAAPQPTPIGSTRAAEAAAAQTAQQSGVTIINNESAEPLHIAAEVAWNRAL